MVLNKNTFNNLLALYDAKKPYYIPTKKRQFFNFEEYVEAQLICPGGLTIINGGRDIGKTTGTFIAFLRDYANSENQIFFLRNSEKEILSFAKTLNAQYGREFTMLGNTLYKMKPEVWVNKKTKEEETRYVKSEVVGFAGSLSGIDGWRSANFEKVKFVFADEYNQIGNSLNAEKFLTLWTSILRTRQDVYTVIIGNRDDVAADLLIELGVRINIDNQLKGDYIVPLLPNDEHFKDKCFFIDLDDSRFVNNAVHTVWKAIGRLTNVMGNYYDRGYKNYENLDCFKLSNEQLNEVEWEDDIIYLFGSVQLRWLIGKLNGITIVHWIDNEDSFEITNKWADLISLRKNPNRSLIRASYFFRKYQKVLNDQTILFTSLTIKEVFHKFFNNQIIEYNKTKDTYTLG